jgi:dipeptidyl aminopeptidase/acylaminoacyl peptidase
MMTYQALARTDRVAAAIVGAGLTDQFDCIKRRPELQKVLSDLVPDYAENKQAALTARSAVFWPEKLHTQTPILILHGSADWRCHPSQSLRLVEKLYELKHPVRFVLFEGGDHGLSEYRAEVNRLAMDWLGHYVRDRKPWPSLEPHGR